MFYAHGSMAEVGESVGGDEIKVVLLEVLYVVVYFVEGIGGICVAGDDDVTSGFF